MITYLHVIKAVIVPILSVLWLVFSVILNFIRATGIISLPFHPGEDFSIILMFGVWVICVYILGGGVQKFDNQE